MRARNIKPGFFANELLAECDLAARLLFIGLWCIADREGRLEDRPARIKAQLFAYEDHKVDPLLEQLSARGFIVRYEAPCGTRLIQIEGFVRHQNPHHREAPSKFPACKAQGKPRASLGQAQGAPGKAPTATPEGPDDDESRDEIDGDDAATEGRGEACFSGRAARAQGAPQARPGKALLIPDTGFLIPDSSKTAGANAPQAPVSPHRGSTATGVTREASRSKEPSQAKPGASGEATAFPCVEGHWSPTPDMVEAWQGTFGAIDVPRQLSLARQWCIDNPKRRKTKRGMRAFIFKWLTNCTKEPKRVTQSVSKQVRHVLLDGQ